MSYSLYHHGIKGQKWGVRRFQNTDGSYTAAGKERYNNKVRTNKRVSEAENDDRTFLDDVKDFYNNHEREIKIGAAAIGVGLAIYGGYKLYQHAPIKQYGAFSYDTSEPLASTLGSYSDITPRIPKDVTFHRISREAFADYSDTGSAYVTYKFRDNARYVADSSNKWSFPGGERNFIHEFTPDKQIRVPSARAMAELYLEQHPTATDQQFRFVVTHGFVQWDTSHMHDSVTSYAVSQANDFRRTLLSNGYDAIVDLEDAGGSGVELPLILLNPSEMSTASRGITQAERVVAYFARRK